MTWREDLSNEGIHSTGRCSTESSAFASTGGEAGNKLPNLQRIRPRHHPIIASLRVRPSLVGRGSAVG